MRLIDADEYVKSMCNSCDGSCDKVDCDCLNCHEDCRCEFARKLDDFPTIEAIPLSVIEKIHDAVDNADADGDIEDDHGCYIGSVFTDQHVHEIIDKAVKEIKHECSY